MSKTTIVKYKSRTRTVTKYVKKRTAATKLFKYKQTYITSNVISNPTSSQFYSFTFRLSDLPQASTFEALYDQYKVTKLTYEFWPAMTMGTPSSALLGTMISVIDYDDATIMTSPTQLLEYGNAKVTSIYKPQKRTFKPHIAGAVYSGAFTSFSNLKDQWIDVGSPSVEHYGLKICTTPTNTPSVVQQWTVIVTAHVEFKNVR